MSATFCITKVILLKSIDLYLYSTSDPSTQRNWVSNLCTPGGYTVNLNTTREFYILLDEAASASSKAFTTLCSCNQVVPDPLLALALNSSSVSCVSAKIFFVFIALFSCTTFNNFTACGLRVSSYSFSAFKISPEEGLCNAVSGKTDIRARYRA